MLNVPSSWDWTQNQQIFPKVPLRRLLSSLQKLQDFCLIFTQKIMLQSKYSIVDLLKNLPVT